MLEDLYAPKNQNPTLPAKPLSQDEERGEFMRELRLVQLDSSSIGGPANTSAFEEVEQEREVAYEIEEEREIRRPPPMKANTFPGLHESMVEFVKTGTLADGDSHLKAFEFLASTQLGLKHGARISHFLPSLHVSAEFTRTVILRQGEKNDNFTRPVKWVLYSTITDTALVIIPEEAEKLIPILLQTSPPKVYLILYAAPVTKRMLHFNGLDYFTIPELPTSWKPSFELQFELGVLAGRLYFEFSEYERLLDRLGLNDEPQQEDFKSFIGFLQEWIALRRQGQDISHTPMGYLCQGWKLNSDHHFFLPENMHGGNDDAGDPESEFVSYAVGEESEGYSEDEYGGVEFEAIDDEEED